MSQDFDLSLAIRGTYLFRRALHYAVLKEQSRPMFFEGAAYWGDEIRERLSRFVLKTHYRRVLKKSVWGEGASRQEIRRWADEVCEAQLLFSELASKLVHNKLPEEFRGPGHINTEYPSPLVFLEKAKTCAPDEYDAWVLQAIGKMLKSIGVSEASQVVDKMLKNIEVLGDAQSQNSCSEE